VSQIEKTIKQVHNIESLHAGYRKTYKRISERYSGIPKSLVYEYVKRCGVCQSSKTTNPPLAASRGRKRKKTSADYFNSLLDHCKELCKRVSAQGAESYEKVLPLIDWLTANFNNSGSHDGMRLSMASYLSLDLEDEKAASVLSAPSIKPPAGVPTTKRKKTAVEASQSSRSVKSCGLCKNKGHTKPRCPLAAQIGRPLTDTTWRDYRQLPAMQTSSAPFVSMNDIPKDLVVLQLTQRVLDVESELGAVFLVKGYRAGLSPSDLAPFLVPLSVLEKWCNGGKSQSRYVFLKSSTPSSSSSLSSSSSSYSSSSFSSLLLSSS
jgi:hypothetical protein